MRTLVVGAAGQVGRSLVLGALRRGDTVLGTYKTRKPDIPAATIEPLDKTDQPACHDLLTRFRPDVVVDTGALHNVDYCEVHPDEAFRVNRDGTQFLADASAAVDARFVFISTDFVFDGRKGSPYVESDSPFPESRYAESKLAGERATLLASSRHLVVRPSVIYSWLDSRMRTESSSGKGMNFGTWLVEEVGRGHTVRIIQDQIASPTLAEDLSGAILALAARGGSGTFHAAGATAVSRFDFSVQLVERLGLDSRLITPVSTRELRQTAKRPPNSSLTSERLSHESGYRMLELPSALDLFAHAFEEDPGALRSGG